MNLLKISSICIIASISQLIEAIEMEQEQYALSTSNSPIKSEAQQAITTESTQEMATMLPAQKREDQRQNYAFSTSQSDNPALNQSAPIKPELPKLDPNIAPHIFEENDTKRILLLNSQNSISLAAGLQAGIQLPEVVSKDKGIQKIYALLKKDPTGQSLNKDLGISNGIEITAMIKNAQLEIKKRPELSAINPAISRIIQKLANYGFNDAPRIIKSARNIAVGVAVLSIAAGGKIGSALGLYSDKKVLNLVVNILLNY
ncbi:hypothetical protein TAO_0189 [Candidatus Nitrosoglobus terrae]|uniref:Uncharacterized protein n=1 Tax=Candidatus Nitrosoglobus terrae TaxID=1630141 RepID=A0A1Q2SKB5_9GAMM|nr:hypothetical protein [Candidatus Nitrosoglobus terrae]BAW79559.1 hypothetical protein TAO_0189 [Candidatus Nitrosoglobus terrae]